VYEPKGSVFQTGSHCMIKGYCTRAWCSYCFAQGSPLRKDRRRERARTPNARAIATLLVQRRGMQPRNSVLNQ